MWFDPNKVVSYLTGTTTLSKIAPIADSTTAIKIVDATGTSVEMTFDTTNDRVQIGTGAGSNAPTLLVLDTKNTTNDPAGVPGAMYYNSVSTTMRCYINGAWESCGAVQDDYMTFVATSTNPATPAAGEAMLYFKPVAGRLLPTIIGPAGMDIMLQPFLARNKIGYWNPSGNSTTMPGIFGFPALTTTGTVTVRNVATTNYATRLRRIGFVSATTAGQLAGNRTALTQFTVGDGAGNGGFTFITRWVTSDASTVSGARMFVGLTSTTGVPTNVEPSTLLNSIGVAQLSTAVTCQIVYGGSAAQTPIVLTGFDCRDPAQAYEIALFAPPNSNNTVYYQVTKISDNSRASGTLTGVAGTALPLSSTLLGYTAWRTNNATAAAVGIDIASIYIETDN
jgi:hypothetical protein